MRRPAIALVLAAATALAATPARAADQSVQAGAGGYAAYSPSSVTILEGESVTWTNYSGTHNVHFDDGFQEPMAPSSSNWTVKRTFALAGDYRYHCDFHGAGMSGRVIVQPPGGGPPPPGDMTAPDIDSLRIVPATFCNKASDRCPKRGARLRFTIDEAADVAGRIVRRKDSKQVGTLKIDAKPGSNSLKFTGKGLKNGKYLLELTAEDAAGNASPVNRTGFKIAASR